MFKKWFGFGKKEDQNEEPAPAVIEEEAQLSDDENAQSETSTDSESSLESDAEEALVNEQANDPHLDEDEALFAAEEETEKFTEDHEVAEQKAAVQEILEQSTAVQEMADQNSEGQQQIVDAPELLEDGDGVEEIVPESIESKEIEESVLMTEPAEEKKVSFFARLKEGLTKTTKAFTDKIDNLFNQYDKIDEDLYEELEEILIMADIGMETTLKIVERLKAELVKRKISEPSLVKPVLKDVIADLLNEKNNPKLNLERSPSILFVIGVNGAGKTTTIGKIARNLKAENKEVILAAADTFRAAAIDQLKIWGERAGVPVISQQEGSDPAAVVYDSIRAAKARHTDVLIIDTAGRLHNKVNLMNELAKIFKVIEREFPEAEKEVLLVLDATTGQNGLQQAKLFKEAANITGIVLTKLDGTAKGGIVLAINNELGIPIKLIGVGEGINDLQVFDAKNFADALIGD